MGALRRAFVPVLAAAALPAHAVVLGDLEVRSALGEALDARIVLEQADAQAVDAACFSLVRGAADGIPALAEGILTIERIGSRTALRIRSLGGMYEPAMALRVRAACPGDAGAVQRQYSILLDPRPGTQVVVAPPVVERSGEPGSASELRTERVTPPAAAAGTVASLNARPGDSLRSIAAAVFPRDRQAQAQYLAALREANPPLAAQSEGEPLPEGTAIALPDLRTYARAAIDSSRGTPRAERRTRAEPAPGAPRERRTRAEPAAAPAAPTASAAKAAAAPAAPRGDAFVLKLSSNQMDLSRTREVDERVRAQLRERLLVLDADDQVSALLAMRNSLRQLETRVSELQLKLAAMPANLASAPAPAAPAPSKAAEPAGGTGSTGTAATAPAVAPPVPAAEAQLPTPSAISPTTSPAVTVPPPSTTASPPPPKAGAETAPPAEPAPRSRPMPRQQSRFELSPWLWGLVALLTVLALLLAWSLKRRKTYDEEPYEYDDAQTVLAEPEAAPAPADAMGELRQEDLRATAESDAQLPTRLADDSAGLRRRYLEERFPEVANRHISLEQPESVVKGARLFYEDGAVARAVELLQFAIEENPGEVKLWLALFEIFRLEGNAAAFAELAQRFRQRHEKSGYWLKVQYIGREIDAGNALYRDESFSKLETIGPSAARRLAAATYDPIAENWLAAPMDFQNQVLAAELRRALMTHAAVAEQDLVPNPMPALRNVEMFQLA